MVVRRPVSAPRDYRDRRREKLEGFRREYAFLVLTDVRVTVRVTPGEGYRLKQANRAVEP